MSRSRFEDDLLFGREAEDRVAALLFNDGRFTVRRVNHGSRQDLQVGWMEYPYRVEVKREDRQSTTGNLCIEMAQSAEHRPSGLALSEATIWIHTLGDDAAIYRTQPMRLALKQFHMQRVIVLQKFKGADHDNMGYILPIRLIASEPWFELCPFRRLPDSRVWREHEIRRAAA